MIKSLENNEYGKVPPQSTEMEELVLGALMIEKDSFLLIGDFLKTEMFYKESHALIYKAIVDLSSNNEPVDLMTVTNKVRSNGDLETVGGAFAITDLTMRITSAANIEYHARIIQQNYLKREVIRISSESVKNGFDETYEAFDLINELSLGITNLYESLTYNKAVSFSDNVKAVYDVAVSRRDVPKDQKYDVPSCELLDELLHGFRNGHLYIIAARPSMGKTAYMLQLVRNVAKKGYPVVVFSLEMPRDELVARILSGESEINSHNIVSGDMTNNEWTKLENSIQAIKDVPIYIDDTSKMNVVEFKTKANKYKNQFGIKAIFVDYLQLMDGDSKYKNDTNKEMGSISRAGKQIAKDLGIPVIMLSQLSRKVEGRGKEQLPMLSDLRDSGEIEQDADVVLFPHRLYYVGVKEDSFGNSTYNSAHVYIAKNRGGALGVVEYYVSDDKTNWGRPKDVGFYNVNEGMKPNEYF